MWNTRNDCGRLRLALVHRPGPEVELAVPLNAEHSVSPADIVQLSDLRTQFDSFVSLLHASGVETVDVRSALSTAIEQATPQVLDSLALSFGVVRELKSPSDLVECLLGARADDLFATNSSHEFSPRPLPVKFLVFTRDAGFFTPAGFVMCRSWDFERAGEYELISFLFSNHPRFRTEVEIALDLAKIPGAFAEGGDTILLDSSTVLMGVGNKTNALAAQAVADSLGLKVLGVRMPVRRTSTEDAWTELHTLFLHLDSLLSHLGSRFLALPYLFERSSVLKELLRGIAMDMERNGREPGASLIEFIEQVDRLGTVTEYTPRQSARDTGIKLFEYLGLRSAEILDVGGSSNTYMNELHHAFVALREIRFQAANVLQIDGRVLIANEACHATVSGLRQNGYDVLTFNSSAYAQWRGGPHCIALPAVREAPQ